jgi:hypothetical protein
MKNMLPLFVLVFGFIAFAQIMRGLRELKEYQADNVIPFKVKARYGWIHPVTLTAFAAFLFSFLDTLISQDSFAGFGVVSMTPIAVISVALLNSLLVILPTRSLKFLFYAGYAVPALSCCYLFYGLIGST